MLARYAFCYFLHVAIIILISYVLILYHVRYRGASTTGFEALKK